MEVPLTPGTVAFIINIITDTLAIIVMFGLVKCLNAYGRWKLYKSGRVNMNMHFHNMDFSSALVNAFRVRRGSKSVFAMLFLQAVLGLAILGLKTTAPIGLSQSKLFRIARIHILTGEAACRGDGQSHAQGHIGEAVERIKTHFRSGGSNLRVGRTGKNSDALIMEDEQYSLGAPIILREFKISVPFKVKYGSSPEIERDHNLFFKGTNLDISGWMSSESIESVDYPAGLSLQVIEGPIHFIYFVPNPKIESYSFARCDVPRLEVLDGESRNITGKCTMAVFQREKSKAGTWMTISPIASPLGVLDEFFSGLSMAELGQKWLMTYDLAKALSQDSCGDTYVAYLPLSEISGTSIVIMCILGGLAIAGLVTAFLSVFVTRGTFDWNGSYQRVINLAANSESIQLKSWGDISKYSKAHVVIEASDKFRESSSLNFRAVAEDVESSPVPEANIKLIS
ncbi:hypothetical protein FGB62_105g00 [Gracilaria domingensis]|nr:hypothetical protein FGB62_105g00 [Gracilaria domingensis]